MKKKRLLDAVDIRILSFVQQYGYLSKSALSEKVNLSATACWTRFIRLKEEGYIQGCYGDVDLNKLTDVTKVIVTVSLNSHRKEDFKHFENFIHQTDEVIDCVATGGGSDYVMTVLTPNLAAFQKLMDSLLDDVDIDRYFTYIATRNVKRAQPNIARLMAKGVD